MSSCGKDHIKSNNNADVSTQLLEDDTPITRRVMLAMAFIVSADLPVVQNNLLTEPLTSPPPQQPKKKGGARVILLQPPVSLLFDDAPAKEVEGSPKQPYIVSGRIAKTRFVLL